MNIGFRSPRFLFLWAIFTLGATGFGAEEGAINSGDTAFILIASAMVLLMTPGLAFFYGGMVRSKNVVSTLFQNYAALSLIAVLWAVVGYSLAFGSGSGFIGGLSHLFLNGVGQEPNGTIPNILFMCFQGMFAIITPVLITGAFCERVNFKSWLILMGAWSLVVYAPVCHWVWGGGWIGEKGGLDFAGGFVVHMTAGYSALVAAILLGKGGNFGKEPKPYNVGMVLLGTALLWFGWFGFNAGSALAADGIAAQAFTTTFLSGAAAFSTWALVDWMQGKPGLMGACIGTVAGLVAITPGAGFVSAGSALFIGAAAGVICNVAARMVKGAMQVDDTLDVFACHGVGGTFGILCTGLLATTGVNPGGANGLFNGGSALFTANLMGAVAVAVYSMGATFILIKIVSAISPLRASTSDESKGLDASQHNEAIETKAA